MIFKKTIESLETTPLEIAKTLTYIKELKQTNEQHFSLINSMPKDLLSNQIILQQDSIEQVKNAFLHVHKAEKEINLHYENLLRIIDDQLVDFESEIKDFESNCCAAALKMKAINTDFDLPTSDKNEDSDVKYCFCNKKAHGEMVGCDGKDCTVEWYHLECLGLKEVPKGNWVCDLCKRN